MAAFEDCAGNLFTSKVWNLITAEIWTDWEVELVGLNFPLELKLDKIHYPCD